jgi:preprotein translocase subunit YajC
MCIMLTYLLLAEGNPGAGGGMGSMLFLFAGLFFLFYFIVLRPMRREEADRRSMQSGLKKNDKILTHAGIYGTVVSVSDTEDEIVVKVDDNVRLRMVRAAVARNITNEEAAKQQAQAAGNKDQGSSTKEAITAKGK